VHERSGIGRYRRFQGASAFRALPPSFGDRFALRDAQEILRRGVALGHRQRACACRHLALAAWLAFTGMRLPDVLRLTSAEVEEMRLPVELWEIVGWWAQWRKRWGAHLVSGAPFFCTITVSSARSRRRFWPGPMSQGNARNAIRRLGDLLNVADMTPGRLSRSGPFEGVPVVRKPRKPPRYSRARPSPALVSSVL
jgi:hypothetical protein